MASREEEIRCIICKKKQGRSRCNGCRKDFCDNHIKEHHQELNKHLEEIGDDYNLFSQTFIEQTKTLKDHRLLNEIDKWELNSIHIIKETARKHRQIIIRHTNEHTNHIDQKLKKLTQRLKESREEENILEDDLQEYSNQLQKLNEQLNVLNNICIRQTSTTLINEIYVDITSKLIIETN